jgi:F0F1-type ATP synthase membrane subunit b/b'
MEHVEPLMGIILPYANFFIFLGLAVYFFKKPARAAAAAKKQQFDKLMAEATQARDAAVAKLEELKRRQAGLDREIEALKQTSEITAKQESEKILADAERLANHLRAEARRIADAEVEKARAALRREIVEAVRDSVTHKIKAELKEEAHLSLVRERITDLNRLRVEG